MKRVVMILLALGLLAGSAWGQLESTQFANQPLNLTYAFCDTALASDVKVVDVTGRVEVLTFNSDKACSLRYVANAGAIYSAPANCYRVAAGAVFTMSNRNGIDSLFIYNEEATEAKHCLLGQRR